MTLVTGVAIVRISGHTSMFVIHVSPVIVFMTVDTAKDVVVIRIGVAFRTSGPFISMFPAVYRKILSIVIEGGRHPGVLAVAGFAIGRKLRGLMIRVVRLVVIIQVAAHTGVGRVVVISVVTGGTIILNVPVSTQQRIEPVMVGQCGRLPSRIRSVAGCAFHGKAQAHVIRVGRLVEVLSMTAFAGVRRISVTAPVAGETIIADEVVSAGERIIIIVIECGRDPGGFRMAVDAFAWILLGFVIGVAGLVVIVQMTSHAGVGRVVVVSVMASGAIGRNQLVRAIQGIIAVVIRETGRLPIRIGGVA